MDLTNQITIWRNVECQSIPDVFGFKIPNRWITWFETWVVTQAKLSPTCLDSRCQTVGLPDFRLGWSPKPNHPRRVRIQGAEPLDYPIWDLGGHPSQIILDVFGFKVSNRWITRFETWVVTQAKSSPTCSDSRYWTVGLPDLRLGWSPKPNHPPRVRIQGAEPLDYPIWDLGGHPSQIIPHVFGFKVLNRWITRFETWVVTQAKSSPTCSDSRCRTVGLPDLRLGWSPKPNHPRHVRIQGSKPLYYLIWDLGGHPSQITLDVFGFKDPNRCIALFETWVVTQAKSSPTYWDSRIQTVVLPDLRLGWSAKPNNPQRIWIQGSKPLYCPIWDLGGHPRQIIPNSRSEYSLRPNYPQFETWMVIQAKSSPIRDLSSHSGWIIPDLRLRWSSKPNHP